MNARTELIMLSMLMRPVSPPPLLWSCGPGQYSRSTSLVSAYNHNAETQIEHPKSLGTLPIYQPLVYYNTLRTIVSANKSELNTMLHWKRTGP